MQTESGLVAAAGAENTVAAGDAVHAVDAEDEAGGGPDVEVAVAVAAGVGIGIELGRRAQRLVVDAGERLSCVDDLVMAVEGLGTWMGGQGRDDVVEGRVDCFV